MEGDLDSSLTIDKENPLEILTPKTRRKSSIGGVRRPLEDVVSEDGGEGTLTSLCIPEQRVTPSFKRRKSSFMKRVSFAITDNVRLYEKERDEWLTPSPHKKKSRMSVVSDVTDEFNLSWSDEEEDGKHQDGSSHMRRLPQRESFSDEEARKSTTSTSFSLSSASESGSDIGRKSSFTGQMSLDVSPLSRRESDASSCSREQDSHEINGIHGENEEEEEDEDEEGETMDLTCITGRILKVHQPSPTQTDIMFCHDASSLLPESSQDEHEEKTMEFTSVVNTDIRIQKMAEKQEVSLVEDDEFSLHEDSTSINLSEEDLGEETMDFTSVTGAVSQLKGEEHTRQSFVGMELTEALTSAIHVHQLQPEENGNGGDGSMECSAESEEGDLLDIEGYQRDIMKENLSTKGKRESFEEEQPEKTIHFRNDEGCDGDMDLTEVMPSSLALVKGPDTSEQEQIITEVAENNPLVFLSKVHQNTHSRYSFHPMLEKFIPSGGEDEIVVPMDLTSIHQVSFVWAPLMHILSWGKSQLLDAIESMKISHSETYSECFGTDGGCREIVADILTGEKDEAYERISRSYEFCVHESITLWFEWISKLYTSMKSQIGQHSSILDSDCKLLEENLGEMDKVVCELDEETTRTGGLAFPQVQDQKIVIASYRETIDELVERKKELEGQCETVESETTNLEFERENLICTAKTLEKEHFLEIVQGLSEFRLLSFTEKLLSFVSADKCCHVKFHLDRSTVIHGIAQFDYRRPSIEEEFLSKHFRAILDSAKHLRDVSRVLEKLSLLFGRMHALKDALESIQIPWDVEKKNGIPSKLKLEFGTTSPKNNKFCLRFAFPELRECEFEHRFGLIEPHHIEDVLARAPLGVGRWQFICEECAELGFKRLPSHGEQK
eukprot:TRINITY_DN2662_c0_g1_i2.p1 TRINITY_DN2662_c0_g1~~TRINITY_DN2662_c0_g1_i2.p1  ORF type:complete len:894 (+),score=285.45 TRINITY_DN2662_c0_g1_i2:144-2825(+)